MLFRNAEVHDGDAMRAILGDCYRRFAVTDGWPEAVTVACETTLASAAAIRAMMATGKVHLAIDDAACVGMVGVEGHEITALFVHSVFQRGGIGAFLFRWALTEIRNQGHDQAVVAVVAGSAIGFYERKGMRMTATARVSHGPCRGMTYSQLTYAFRQ